MEENPDTTVSPPQGGIVPVGSLKRGHTLPLCNRTDAAARLLVSVLSYNMKFSAAEAMKVYGFSEEECANRALQRRVLRLKSKYMKETSIPTTIALPVKAPTISPLASAGSPTLLKGNTETGNCKCSCCKNCNSQNKSSITTPSTNSGNKRSINIDDVDADDAGVDADDVVDASRKTKEDPPPAEEPISLKKPRRNHSQLMYDMATKQQGKDKLEESYAAAAKLFKEQTGPKHISLEQACAIVNKMNGTDIKRNTLKKRLSKANKGLPIGGRGRPSTLPDEVHEALVTAMETSFLICSAGMKVKPNRKQAVEDLEACLSRGPCSLKDFNGLYRRLQPKFALSIEVNKCNSQLEERRALWTTYNKINEWFSNLKTLLLEKEFARLPTDVERFNGHVGELVFMPRQLHRILNVNETGLTLDGTCTRAGGRPVIEYSPRSANLPKGATKAHKSSSRCTMIGGSTAAGDPIPVHFQLKSTAATEQSKRISRIFTDELDRAGTCDGIWGFNRITQRPHTANCNANAGMDSNEFRKYVLTSLLPLYPDVQPANGKWVLLIVDSGPGRLDRELLQELSVKGVLLLPGVPNTTHVTQVTDWSYSPFKTAFRKNRKKLHAMRVVDRSSLRTSDYPVLVFGLQETWGTKLESAFDAAFSPDRSKSFWEKVGISPFTRKCLGDRNVVHELMILPNGDIDEKKDPATVKILELERRNAAAVETLINFGFDGEVFRKQALRNQQRVTRSEATTARAIQDAIAKANTAGKKYIVLGGRPYNCHDQHIADERERHEKVIEKMKSKKAEAEVYAKKETDCKALIQSCSGDFAKLRVNDMKKIYEWKLGKKPTGLKKEDILTALAAVKDDPPVGAVQWTEGDDADLKKLEQEDITIKDTEVAKKMAVEVTNALITTRALTNERAEIVKAHMSPEVIKMMEESRAHYPCEE